MSKRLWVYLVVLTFLLNPFLPLLNVNIAVAGSPKSIHGPTLTNSYAGSRSDYHIDFKIGLKDDERGRSVEIRFPDGFDISTATASGSASGNTATGRISGQSINFSIRFDDNAVFTADIKNVKNGPAETHTLKLRSNVDDSDEYDKSDPFDIIPRPVTEAANCTKPTPEEITNSDDDGIYISGGRGARFPGPGARAIDPLVDATTEYEIDFRTGGTFSYENGARAVEIKFDCAIHLKHWSNQNPNNQGLVLRKEIDSVEFRGQEDRDLRGYFNLDTEKNAIVYHLAPGEILEDGDHVLLKLDQIINPDVAENYTIYIRKLWSNSSARYVPLNLEIKECDGYFCIFSSLAKLPNKLLTLVASSIGDIIVGFGRSALSFAGSLLQTVLNVVAGLPGEPSVGYVVTLNLTNLGIAIALIVIGFGTILGRQSYNAEHNLVRLILVAIGINFSWFVANKIIVVSNQIGLGFLKSLVNLESLGAILGGGLVSNLSFDVSGAASLLSALILGPIFTAFFLIILTFSLVVMVIMFVVRIVALQLLLAVMPIAILASVFPHTAIGEWWTKWRDNFIKWVIFFPAAAFFLGLAAAVAREGAPADATPVFGQLIYMFIVIGIMIGGTLIANKLGLQGAALGNMAGVWAGKKAAGALSKPFSAVGDRFKKRGEAIRKAAEFRNRVVPLSAEEWKAVDKQVKRAEAPGKLFGTLGEKGAKMGKSAGDFKKFKKKFKKKTMKEAIHLFDKLEGGPMADLFGKSKEEKLAAGIKELREAYKQTGKEMIDEMEGVRAAIQAANPGKSLEQFMEEYRREKPEIRKKIMDEEIKPRIIAAARAQGLSESEAEEKAGKVSMLDNVMFGIDKHVGTLSEKIAEERAGVTELLQEVKKIAKEASSEKKSH